MKHLNFLSNLLSLSLGSQSSEVGFDYRLTVGSPSGLDAKWKQNPFMRFAVVLTLIFTIGSGNVWGASVTWEQVAWGDITTSDVIIVTVTTSNGTYLLEHSQGTSATPKLGNTGTLTNSNANCTFNENDNVKWKKDANNRLCKASDGTKWLYTGTSNNAMRVGTSTSGNVWTLDGDYIKSNTSTARYLSVYSTTDFRSYTSKQSGQVTRFYKASSCDAPTVGSSLSLVSASTNSITATVPISATGGCDITANGLVYSSTVATPTVGTSGCSTATVTACGGTAANKTVTISGLTCGQSYNVRGYATNAAGTSYTDVTTQSTSACPKYTVTLKDDETELTQATAGASITLPSRAGCTGYTFAGWTKTWVAPQSSWTTTAPTIIPPGGYTPSDNENLYPVYTKTEGGGTTETTVTETFTNQTSHSSESNWKQALTWGASESDASIEWTTYYGKIANGYTEIRTYSDNVMGYLWTSEPITGLKKVKFKGWHVTNTDAADMVVSYSTDNDTWYELGTHAATSDNSTFSDEFEITSSDPSTAYYLSIDLSEATCPTSSNKKYRIDDIVITTETGGGSTTLYISMPDCCTPLGSINGSFGGTPLFEPFSLDNSWLKTHTKHLPYFLGPISYPAPLIYTSYISRDFEFASFAHF